MAHWEIIGTLIYKIIDRADPEELKKAGLDAYYVQHGHDLNSMMHQEYLDRKKF